MDKGREVDLRDVGELHVASVRTYRYLQGGGAVDPIDKVVAAFVSPLPSATAFRHGVTNDVLQAELERRRSENPGPAYSGTGLFSTVEVDPSKYSQGDGGVTYDGIPVRALNGETLVLNA